MIHDDLTRAESHAPPTERSFGIGFAGFGVVAAAYCAWTARPSAAAGFALAGVAMLACAYLAPRVLALPNRLWFRFGMILHRVMQPLVLGAMFYGIVAPIGLLMRASGADPLRLKRRREQTTYWIDRDTQPTTPDSFRNQF